MRSKDVQTIVLSKLNMDDTTSKDWLVLLGAPALGPKRLSLLFQQFTSPSEVIGASRSALKSIGIPDATIDYFGSSPQPDQRSLAWLEHPDHHLVFPGDVGWPAQLEDVEDAPAALFVAGHAEALLAPQVAIVGSRNATRDGLDNAYRFARALTRAGFAVTSGLALGVDTAAHRGAMESGPTVAVLGSGADRIYPTANQGLADRVVTSGCLVSEFMPGTAPRREHFPRRNRIISGLALGVLVVEAGLKSGSLITARLAAEQGRTVCALPGSIHNPLAKGCHRLIKEGATLIETSDELIETMRPLAQRLGVKLRQRLDAVDTTIEATPAGPNLTEDADYQRLVSSMGFDPQPIDMLVERSGLSASAVSSMLLILELEGLVQSYPGRRYAKCPVQ